MVDSLKSMNNQRVNGSTMRWKIEAIYTKHIQNKKRSDWIDIHEDEDGDDDKDKG